MSKKKILASVLASVGALATSMAHGKIGKSALLGVSRISNGTVSSRFLKGGHGGVDAEARLNSVMKLFKTEAKVGAGLLATYGLLEGYVRYGEDIKGGLKKIFIRNTKEENSGDEYIGDTSEPVANNVNYINENENLEVNNNEYIQNESNNSVNNTRNENSENAGVYRLEVNGTNFFVVFGKSTHGESDKIYALFSQDRDEIQKLIEEKKNDNAIRTTKKQNVSISPSSRKDPEFLKGMNAIIENYLQEQGARNLKGKANRGNVKNKEYIRNDDEKVKRMVDKFITSIGKALGIKKFDDNFKDDILNCLPDSIRLLDIDTAAAKGKVSNDVSVFSLDS